MSSRQTANYHPDGTLFIVSGPSGAGKTTLINRVREGVEPLGIHVHFSVSHTTRPPRATEKDGVDYYFVDRSEFEAMAASGEFLEWATVHEHMYGTSRMEVQTRLQRGEDVVLDIDVQGAEQIARSAALRPHSLSIFIFPPSFDELERRLIDRGLNTMGDIGVRMQKALDEILRGYEFYDYVIINDDLTIACSCLKAAIIARKLKSRSALAAIREMAERFKEERSGKIAPGNR
jgi:guanylate kinase